MAGPEAPRVCGPGFHDRVYALVRRVPQGSVTTYGDVARALGHAGVARQVGWALAALPTGSDVPWHRVVGGKGDLRRAGTPGAAQQSIRLRGEGVELTGRGRIVDFAARRHDFGRRAPGPPGSAATLRSRGRSSRRST